MMAGGSIFSSLIVIKVHFFPSFSRGSSCDEGSTDKQQIVIDPSFLDRRSGNDSGGKTLSDDGR